MSITFEQVSFHYGATQATPALDHIDLTIDEGQFVCIIGRTGSGKSTLLELAAGIKAPSEGRVTIQGICTSDKKHRREAMHHIGYVMQRPERQLFAETVYEDVAFGPQNMGIAPKEARALAAEALQRVGLSPDDVGDMSPFDLSGGQKRRCALAGVIATQPHILCVDEPIAGLDAAAKHIVLDTVRELNREGTTVLMVTHSMEDAAFYADRIVVLDRGHLVDDETPSHVFANSELLQRTGLELPAAARVALNLRAQGFAKLTPLPLSLDELAHAVAAELRSPQAEVRP